MLTRTAKRPSPAIALETPLDWLASSITVAHLASAEMSFKSRTAARSRKSPLFSRSLSSSGAVKVCGKLHSALRRRRT